MTNLVETTKLLLDIARDNHKIALSVYDESLLIRLNAKSSLRTTHHDLIQAEASYRRVRLDAVKSPSS